jgi:hypothetical protein
MMHRSLIPHIVVLSMILVALKQKIPTVSSAIAVHLTQSEVTMQAVQVVGFTTIFSAAFIALIYGEILLLHRG